MLVAEGFYLRREKMLAFLDKLKEPMILPGRCASQPDCLFISHSVFQLETLRKLET